MVADKSAQLHMEAKEQAADQNLQNEQKLFQDSIRSEMEEEIRALDEENNNMDVSPSRRRPVSVTGPYIVYMLTEEEILQDLAIIKKALAENERRQTES